MQKQHEEKSYLILTRKINDRLYIGDDIEILIVDINKGRVRLGISADKSLPILRDDARNKKYRKTA